MFRRSVQRLTVAGVGASQLFARLAASSHADARRSIATSSAAVYARTTAAGSGSGAHTPRTTAEEEERVVFLERDGAAAYATLPLLGRAGFNVMCVGQLKNAIALFLRIKEPLESIALHAEADGRPLVLNRDHSIETALRDVKWQPRLRSLRRRLLVRWEVTQRPDGHLELPAGLAWPAASNNVLFVRAVYAPLFESVLNRCLPVAPGTDTANHRRVVTGQPGIGKSVWAWYVAYRVLTEQPGRTVIVASAEDDEGYFIPPQGQGPIRNFQLSKLPLASFDTKHGVGKDPLLIADSVLPPLLPFPTLVVSARRHIADRDLKNILNEYFDVWHYLPVPSEAELLALRAAAFPELDEAGVRRRMELWGPIPRHVLEQAAPRQQQELWARADAVELAALVQMAKPQSSNAGGSGGLDARHHLLHERAAGQDALPGSPAADPTSVEYYVNGVVAIASRPMLRYVAERALREQAWGISSVLDASASIGALGALRDVRFEEVVLAMLAEGVQFDCRELSNGYRVTATIEGMQVGLQADTAAVAVADGEGGTTSHRAGLQAEGVTWSSVSELALHRGDKRLLVPRDRKRAGLDALFWDEEAGHHWPLNCDPPDMYWRALHVRGLAAAVPALGWTSEGGWPRSPAPAADRMHAAKQIKYFLAVPEHLYISAWKTSRYPISREGAEQVLQHVTQYALCVPSVTRIRRLLEACEAQGVPLPHELLLSEDEEE